MKQQQQRMRFQAKKIRLSYAYKHCNPEIDYISNDEQCEQLGLLSDNSVKASPEKPKVKATKTLIISNQPKRKKISKM
jgi:hypothetical protein